MTRWRYAEATDTGLVRQSNQDAVFASSNLAIIADGMGGHAAGEVASAMTVVQVCHGFDQSPTIEGLYRAIEEANRDVIRNAKENPERHGMGTTVMAVGLTIDSEGVASPTMFHVGDSRAYQVRDGALRQLSDDHSVAEEWVRTGRLTPEEALTHPNRHSLTRAIGVEDTVSIDVVSLSPQVGDRILLCSDGLSNELSSSQLADLASVQAPLEEVAAGLIQAAKDAGGRDNISVIVLEFDEVTLSAHPVKRTVSSTPPPVAPTTQRPPVRSRRRRQNFTWRLWASIGAGIAVVIGFFVVMHWYAYSTYYLANDNGVIGVYQGQPSGVLWFGPVKVLDTTYPSNQLRSADAQMLQATISEPSLGAALHYANYLHTAWQLAGVSSSSTTTTTLKMG